MRDAYKIHSLCYRNKGHDTVIICQRLNKKKPFQKRELNSSLVCILCMVLYCKTISNNHLKL